jgi:CDP-diacylglycerol--glycerol-3-phosphate 3-phosphatidyltransferase/cardiolipin synthase
VGWLPNLLSLSRLPLAAAFPLAVSRPPIALVVLVAAGTTDVLDGWLARRIGASTTTGALLDPIADKIFVASVATTLLAHGLLPWWGLAPLLAREVIELPLAIVVLKSHRPRAPRLAQARSNALGKIATLVQFLTVSSALVLPGALRPMLVAAGVAGLSAGVGYGVRELRAPARSL